MKKIKETPLEEEEEEEGSKTRKRGREGNRKLWKNL